MLTGHLRNKITLKKVSKI